MDFNFSDEQTMLRDSLTELLTQHYGFEQRQAIVRSAAGVSESVWTLFEAMGLLALPLPESVGGYGGSGSDIVAISELFGRHLVVEPYLSSIIFAGRALARSERNPQATGWLGQIVAGKLRAALAHEESRGTATIDMISTTAKADGDGYVLRGHKRLVLDGATADVLVVTVRLTEATFGIVAVDPGSDGVTLTPYRTIDGRRAADIRFDDVRVPASGLVCEDAAAAIQDVINDAVLALCAEAVGAMGALLDATASYASTRNQFGSPIAGFQAVAHRIANMKVAYAKARATLIYVTAAIDSGLASQRDYSLIKGQVGRLGREIAESAVQIHGGIGMTEECAVGHHLKRILTIDALFGPADYHLRILGIRQSA